jgi:hypothetical protein
VSRRASWRTGEIDTGPAVRLIGAGEAGRDVFGKDLHLTQQVARILGLDPGQRVLRAQPSVRVEVLRNGLRASGHALGQPRGGRRDNHWLIRSLQAEVEGVRVSEDRVPSATHQLPQGPVSVSRREWGTSTRILAWMDGGLVP